MVSVLEKVGSSAIKALASRRKVGFAPNNMGAGIGSGIFWPNGLMQVGLPHGAIAADGTSPGAAVDPMGNRVVAACVDAKATAMASAPAILEQFKSGKWQPVDHECVGLLNAPNEYHSYYDLQYATTATEDTTGQSFWRIESTRGGIPAEIWVEHPEKFTVKGDRENFISGYTFQGETGPVDLLDKDVIHFRRAIDLRNSRRGTTPLSAGGRQIAGDNAAATYHTAIIHNSGVMSLLIAAKESGTLRPDQIKEFVELVKAKLFGAGAGGIIGLNVPLDVHKMSYSPDEMAINELIRYCSLSICALMGVDPIIIHMASGPDSPTYANMSEAIEDFWTRTIVPTNTRRDSVLTVQYLPLWGLDPKEYRVNRDYSNVPAMQEDKDEIHTRYREDYKAGAFDLFRYQTYLGLEPTEDMKGVFYKPSSPQTLDPTDPTAGATIGTMGKPEDKKPNQPAARKSVTDTEYVPWTDEELDAMSTVTEDDVKRALVSRTPEMQALLRAKPDPDAPEAGQ